LRSFRCASWKRVRIFEGISGIFQDAHFQKMVRIFDEVRIFEAGPWASGPRSRVRCVGASGCVGAGLVIDRLLSHECS
jgi:hypothetical protein